MGSNNITNIGAGNKSSANIVFNDQANTYTGGGAQDFAGAALDNVSSLTSNATFPAAAGVLRLGNLEVIAWKDSENTFDYTLSLGITEQFTFTHTDIDAEPVTVKLLNPDTTLANTDEVGTIFFSATTTGAPTERVFGQISIESTIADDATRAGRMKFGVPIGGSFDVDFLELNGLTLQVELGAGRDLNIAGNNIFNTEFQDYNELSPAPADPGADTARFYAHAVDTFTGLAFKAGLTEVNLTRQSTLKVAAQNSSAADKQAADFVCDGVADDVQIQQAIDALPAAGGIVNLAEGQFKISVALALSAETALIGSYFSTQLDIVGDINCITTAANRISIQNLRITQTDGLQVTKSAIVMDGGGQHKLNNILFNDCWQALELKSLAGSGDLRESNFTNLQAEGCKFRGISFGNDVHGNYFENIRMMGSPSATTRDSMLYIDPALYTAGGSTQGGTMWVNCHFLNAGLSGIHIEDYIEMSFVSVHTDGGRRANAPAVLVQNCNRIWFDQSWFGGSGDGTFPLSDGIQITSGSEDIIIRGCHMQNNSRHGAHISGSKRVIFDACIFRRNAKDATGDGLFLDNADDCIISNSIAYDDGVPNQRYGINISNSTSVNNIIKNMRFEGNVTGSVNDVGTNTVLFGDSFDTEDFTKQVGFDIAGATTATKTTLDFNQTVNRTITFPNATGNVVVDSVANTYGAFLQNFTSATMRIPVSAAPTIAVNGDFAIDTTITDFLTPLIRYFGTESMAVIAVPDAELTTPSDGDAVTYNATTDEFELRAPSGSGDMILASIQTVTGAKTFADDAFLMTLS